MKKLIIFVLVIFVFSEITFSQTWVQKLTGISFWGLTKDPQGNIYTGGTSKNIYKSTDNGDTWTLVFDNGLANILYLACDSNNNVLAAYGGTGVLKSTNGGLNWDLIPGSTFGSNTVNSVSFGKPGHIYVGVTGGGIYRSTDGGVTFPDNALSGVNIVTIHVDKYNYDRIIVSASSTTTNGIFLSTNAGANYTDNLTPGTNSWAVIQKSATEFYSVGTSSGYPVLKSTNSGLNWTTISNFSSAKRGGCMDPAGNIYASGNSGAFKSTDNGVTFVNFNFTISANHSLSNGNRIFVATSGSTNGGVWIYTDTTLTGLTKLNTTVPFTYSLEQNYPNPFNSSTNIKFRMSNSGSVKLSVFDISGRLIKSLVNEYLQPGEYNYNFNSADLSSGIYFYKILINEGKDLYQVKKMMILK
ncbi:MAG: T9SS type A sorting domain-containing protein [Ignavibacteria bacterium]|nr:T9SS type A sorting domain-containing protein [Ignavibacteria bacterium]